MIRRYQIEGNEDWAYETLVSGNWARTFLIGKQKGTVTAFKEHVSHVSCCEGMNGCGFWGVIV